MDDRKIIALFFSRSETALALTKEKYGKYCRKIAYNILGSEEDADEAVNLAYLNAWETIPPKDPDDLGAYIGMLCRSRAIDIRKTRERQKRGGSEYDLALDELEDCLPGEESDVADAIALRDALGKFLSLLKKRERAIFMSRYFWSSSVSEISNSFAMREGAVKMALSRTRAKLKDFLKKEGFDV
ncbi:MAG: sigma-70 family RNA polymerase sigma factor [Clostridia bacterium]|nr:sigma-70 family RNA polymerase sigma factor [Clostridia bacterium]